MAKIDAECVEFLRTVIWKAGEASNFFIKRSDYTILIRAIDEMELLGHSKVWIDDNIWNDVLSTGKLYGLKVPINSATISATINEARDKSPHEWEIDDPSFAIEGWENLDIDKILPGDMSRHFMVLGETGSGKTVSGIKPLLRSILSYDGLGPEMKPAALIIDPKSELFSFAKNVAPERLEKDAVVLDLAKFDYQINAYEGIEESQLTPRRILEIVAKLSKSMRDDMFLSKKEPYWTNAPLDILENMLAVILYCHRKLSLDFWSELEKTIVSPDSESSLWRAEISEAEKEGRAPVSLTTRYGISYKRDNFFIPMKNFLSSALHNESWWEAFRDTCKRLKIPFSIWAFAQQIENYGMNLIGSLVSITQMWLNGLVSEELIRHVSINPIEKSKNCLDIEEMINQGKILIYSPNNNSFISDAIGRLIKGHFFAATFRRMNKTRPVAYVCDEFQRFITGDPESGEQSFLDRCRAYRGICVLATQSIASIKKALRDSGEIYPDDCISIILNNTGTKLFFRNTDVDTRDRLVKLIPENSVPLGPHILNARPIPTLKVGECYYLLSSGEWGRRQILIKKSRSTEPEQLTAHYKSQDIISTHRLQGEVTADSILKLCDEIDNAIEYLQLRHVRIEICSPGGVIKALQHYLCKLAEWRQKGVTIATTALIDASSAAAMLLSLGDVGYRTAYSTASLLYHNSRVSATSFGTAESLGKLTGDLQRIDNLMQTELVKHIYDNEKARAQINLSKLHASEIAENLQIRKSRFKNGFPTRKQYETVLKQLFDLDKPIRPEEAILLGLIDRIKDIDNSR